ncbi:MAG TPA: hypothetical protein VHN80_05250 [Kineosporiaceae bacterium]|nr:hypothetical protein [Kineosporiaceae bacterium]
MADLAGLPGSGSGGRSGVTELGQIAKDEDGSHTFWLDLDLDVDEDVNANLERA